MIEGAEKTGEDFNGLNLVTFKIKIAEGALDEIKARYDLILKVMPPGNRSPDFDLWLGFLTSRGLMAEIKPTEENEK